MYKNISLYIYLALKLAFFLCIQPFWLEFVILQRKKQKIYGSY